MVCGGDRLRCMWYRWFWVTLVDLRPLALGNKQSKYLEQVPNFDYQLQHHLHSRRFLETNMQMNPRVGTHRFYPQCDVQLALI